jgi:outer membrane protein assembly factor BamB
MKFFGLLIFLLVSFPFRCLPHPNPFPDDKSTGKVDLSQPLALRWKYVFDNLDTTSPTSEESRVYVPKSDGTIVSLNSLDGQMIWKSEIGGVFSATPIADERGVYVASQTGVRGQTGQIDGNIRLLAGASGVTLWSKVLHSPLSGSLALDKTNLYGLGRDGRVYAIKPESGETTWTTLPTSNPYIELMVTESEIFILDTSGTISSLNKLTGALLWRYQTQHTSAGHLSQINDFVYFGSAVGMIYAVNKNTGQMLWKTRVGVGVQLLKATEYGLVVASLDNFIYCFSLKRGRRMWKHLLTGKVAAPLLVEGDGVLLTLLSSNTSVVLNARNGKQINSIQLGEDNSSSASPILCGGFLCFMTKHGVMAFGRPN